MSARFRVGAWMALGLMLAASASCGRPGSESWVDLERMTVQPKGDAYEASAVFADSALMRMPPDHVVPHEVDLVPAPVRLGRRADGTWLERSPLGYSADLLGRGRDRYGVYCTPCHGFDGSASTPVARRMELAAPPSLLGTEVRARPDGFVYAAIREGYGLMPSYAHALGVDDRWAVVAYLRALQLSRGVPLDSLPSDARRRATEALGRPRASAELGRGER